MPCGFERMRSYIVTDRHGREHLRDELVNYLHFALTGEAIELNLPPAGAYLDAVLGGRELWAGDTPRLGDQFIACVGIEGFPQQSYPQILDALDHLAIPYRWSSRMIHLDQHEMLAELRKFRRKWKQQVRGFMSQVFRTQSGSINEDALLMTQEAEAAITKTSSGLFGAGFYTPVIVLMGADRAELLENARLVVREIQREGFTARVETINTMEAWLGSLPGHPVPNVRRPLIHTDNLADLLPLASVWTGRDTCPCPYYPKGSPPLLHAATTGGTPFRLNLHYGDVGHCLIFGPTGAGKTTLLSTVSMQALRYERGCGYGPSTTSAGCSPPPRRAAVSTTTLPASRRPDVLPAFRSGNRGRSGLGRRLGCRLLRAANQAGSVTGRAGRDPPRHDAPAPGRTASGP